MQNPKKIIGQGFLFFVLMGLVFFSLIEPNIPHPPAKGDSRPDWAFENVRFSLLENGEKVWEIESEVAEIYKKDHVATLQIMKGHIFDGDKAIVDFSAPVARIDIVNFNMEMTDASAEYHLSERTVFLETSNLKWDSAKQEFLALGNVAIVSEGLHLSGESFRVNIRTRKMTLEENSKAVIEEGLVPE